jgi:hypothetical protein
MAAHFKPLSLLSYAARCVPSLPKVLQQSALAAQSHAHARGARRSGPRKCQPRSGQACHPARLRQVGCGPHVTESTALSWASRSLTWDGVSGAVWHRLACSRV